MEQAGEFQGEVGISDGHILTKENRAHDLAKEITIYLTTKACKYDLIEAYQAKLFR